jgi:hypothetical protein
MRIRTIKPEFFLHEELFNAEKETKLPLRIAFAGLWCAADREGRFKWEPRRLGIQILPYDGVDFSRVLDALTTRDFIVHYASGTGDFGVIPSFSKHQVINNRERESDLPDPSQCTQTEHVDASGTREARVDHACKAEGKGREGNKEGKAPKPEKILKPSEIPDDEWIASLKTNPDHEGKNIDSEFRRAHEWCLKNNRQNTRRFFENWLSKVEKPLTIKPKPPAHVYGSSLGHSGPWPKGHSFL